MVIYTFHLWLLSMLDDTHLISNVVSLLKLTKSEHGIYNSSVWNRLSRHLYGKEEIRPNCYTCPKNVQCLLKNSSKRCNNHNKWSLILFYFNQSLVGSPWQILVIFRVMQTVWYATAMCVFALWASFSIQDGRQVKYVYWGNFNKCLLIVI